MRVAIMQPYFMPYIGYFQLIAGVDLFIVYDNIKYTKKGWINRNRFLRGGKATLFTLPLTKDSDDLDVRDRSISAGFDKRHLLNQFADAYRRAPAFGETFPLVESIVLRDESNLFRYIHHSVTVVAGYLGIATRILPSSSLPIDHALRGKEKVLALCRHVGATTYVNAIGGRDLYSPDAFSAVGIALKFIQSRPIQYPQFNHQFVPWLSIIDVLMFNPRERVREYVERHYDLG